MERVWNRTANPLGPIPQLHSVRLTIGSYKLRTPSYNGFWESTTNGTFLTTLFIKGMQFPGSESSDKSIVCP